MVMLMLTFVWMRAQGEKLVEPSGKTATFTAMDPSSSGKPLWWKSGAGGRRRLNEAVAPSPMTRSNPATPSVTPAMPSAAAAPPSGYRRHLLNQVCLAPTLRLSGHDCL